MYSIDPRPDAGTLPSGLRSHRRHVGLAVVLAWLGALSVARAGTDSATAAAPTSLVQAPTSGTMDAATATGTDEDITRLSAVNVTSQATDLQAVDTGATRLPLTIRETPQSVSVISRQTLDDFALNDINAVLDRTTGVTVDRVETDRTEYIARGFEISNFLVDGLGMPFTDNIQNGSLDTSVYERIEVLRGANGLLSFTGNPSATVNFIRKRPTAEAQGSVGIELGSWADHRAQADLSGPLNASRSVRGRLVAADEESDSYLDRYHRRIKVIDGIVEADLRPGSTLSAGITGQKSKPRGVMWGALPLYYTDGTPTHYDRSTSTAADWSYWNVSDVRSFVEFNQDLGHEWTLKSALDYRRITQEGDLFYVYGTPDRLTGRGLYSYPSRYGSAEKQYVGDVYASGPFELGGQRHELVVGANWARSDVSQLSRYAFGSIGLPLPPLEDWTGDFPRPDFDQGYTGRAHFRNERQSGYVTVRWSLGDTLKLITGSALTHVSADGANYGVPHVYNHTDDTPFIGAVYDFAPHYSLYASYAKLFNPQNQTDVNNRVLDPVTGANLEAGIKGAWYDDRLNATFALFRTRQDNLADYAGHSLATNQDYYRGIDAIAKGYEFEISGQLSDDWRLSGGYTQLGIVDPDGHNVRTYVPRRTLRLLSTWRLPATGLKFGTALRWQDDIRRDQAAQTADGQEIFSRQGSYLVLDLMAGYDFAPGWNATLNIDNVTDRKYLVSLYETQSFYAAPRSYRLDLTYRF
ncbi:outer membrane receptor for ferric coprogen and ferric-rhodotorulic acid [Aerosticca soli]|uniref:Outer membrane receptor for ferric coprogen and ferric-rhodotorulic acid n=2 Tax=Aerosticca soli TaxID=2010829 RepID=A0A2Z6E4J4_9GAMM|nr:outer membrane receptor for ferric coprogen and ferric-rhodotorulic acid [Aerosticca soli]